jgi:TonB family protein
LARGFEHEGRKLAFVIDKFEHGESFSLTVAGKPLGGAAKTIRVAFGPDAGERAFTDKLNATLGTFGPAILVSHMTLFENPEDESGASNDGPNLAGERDDGQPERERAVTWFEVQRGKRPPLRFTLGPMDKPLAALRSCTDELLTHWGIDVAAHRSLTRRATPTGNPASWITSNDYPSHLLSNGSQGIIHFRLTVAEDGAVADCHIQQSTRPAEFDKAVCKALSGRARFDPALDATGNPIKSYWRSQVRFEIAD